MPLHDHADRVADEDAVDAGLVAEPGRGVVVGGHDGELRPASFPRRGTRERSPCGEAGRHSWETPRLYRRGGMRGREGCRRHSTRVGFPAPCGIWGRMLSPGAVSWQPRKLVVHEEADPARGKAIVLFDGQCPLCQRSVRSLKRLDWLRRLHFQDCRDTANLPRTAVPLNPERLLEEMHLVTPDRKRAYPGYRAFRWMAWRIPATWWLAPLLYLPGMRWLGTQAVPLGRAEPLSTSCRARTGLPERCRTASGKSERSGLRYDYEENPDVAHSVHNPDPNRLLSPES